MLLSRVFLAAEWLDARGSLPLDAQSTNVIPKTSMQEFYRALGAH